jgi:hypothetical protein
MREEGVDVIAFDRRPGLDLRVAWRMAAEIRARALDVVHAHQYTPFFYGSIAARLSHVRPRVIFTEHGRTFRMSYRRSGGSSTGWCSIAWPTT